MEDFVDDRIAEKEMETQSLREKNERLAQALTKARVQLTEMQRKMDQMTRPPATEAVFLTAYTMTQEIDVVHQGRKMRMAVAPGVELEKLRPGDIVRVNEMLVVVDAGVAPRQGEVVTVHQMLQDGRAIISAGAGNDQLALLSPEVMESGLRTGDTVLYDSRSGFIYERLVGAQIEELLISSIPDVSFDDIGGLGPQIEQVRDAVELPFLRPDLFRSYSLLPPKGVLLYGPPGCGKTLIAKAVAASLAKTASAAKGSTRSYFISVKGPEMLNKYVGETERQIRAIFERARMVASHDVPVVIFFDEMEALFRIRGSGISSDIETMIVPQLLAEIDGVESLSNVIVIGASNREDMIDPAVLRPGRLDIKIRVGRPDEAGAIEIFSKYLTPALPIHPSELEEHPDGAHAVQAMITRAVGLLYSETDRNAAFELTYASGKKDILYIKDLVSGAMIAAIVDRVKKAAIKAEMCNQAGGINSESLLQAVDEEMADTVDLISTSSAEEWGRIAGDRAERIVAMNRIFHAGAPQLG